MPVSVVGGEILTKTALNCRPCSRSVIQVPEAEANSPRGDGRYKTHQRHQFTFTLDVQS